MLTKLLQPWFEMEICNGSYSPPSPLIHHRNLGFGVHVSSSLKPVGAACEPSPQSRILAAEVLRPNIYEVYAFPALPFLNPLLSILRVFLNTYQSLTMILGWVVSISSSQ